MFWYSLYCVFISFLLDYWLTFLELIHCNFRIVCIFIYLIFQSSICLWCLLSIPWFGIHTKIIHIFLMQLLVQVVLIEHSISRECRLEFLLSLFCTGLYLYFWLVNSLVCIRRFPVAVTPGVGFSSCVTLSF